MALYRESDKAGDENEATMLADVANQIEEQV